MPKIVSLHFNADAKSAASAIKGLLVEPKSMKSMLSLPVEEMFQAGVTPAELASADQTSSVWSMETAARHHLQTLLENQGSEMLAEIVSPDRPEAIPDLRLESNEAMRLTDTQRVAFQQTAFSLPVFGMRAIVEINAKSRRLSTVDGLVTHVPAISPIPRLSILDALLGLANKLGKTRDELVLKNAPILCFYPEGQISDPGRNSTNEITWRLVYHFLKIPASPLFSDNEPARGCCGEHSAPFGPIPHDYLIDANDGSIVLAYPSATFIDIPVFCTGTDVEGNQVSFDSIQLNATTFEMTDPLRSVQTLDARFADIALNPNAGVPVTSSNTTFSTSAAAVTAHFFSSQVFDFFNHVLKRNGVDDKGMKLVSIVNCYNSRSNGLPSPGWANAMWYQGKMWYGSLLSGQNPISTARFLDVMAHELAHGVTQTTANLIYQGQSGALNESFSDIFGILIKNWYPGEPNPISGWSWELGEGWRGTGTVLRSIKDPHLGNSPLFPQGHGQPAHMNEYYNGTADYGGVHVNSGIHNRAFYNVMQSKDAVNNPIFTPAEVARLYYITLTRLAPMSDFSECRRTLLNVVTQRHQGNRTAQKEKLDAVRAAYDAVGIV